MTATYIADYYEAVCCAIIKALSPEEIPKEKGSFGMELDLLLSLKPAERDDNSSDSPLLVRASLLKVWEFYEGTRNLIKFHNKHAFGKVGFQQICALLYEFFYYIFRILGC